MTTEDVSRWLSIPVSTLAWWRTTGRGPCFVKAGRAVRYRMEDVERWMQRCSEEAGW